MQKEQRNRNCTCAPAIGTSYLFADKKLIPLTMNNGVVRITSMEGATCPGCGSPYTQIGIFNSNTARIFPICSHNLCETCIVTDGTNYGQVKSLAFVLFSHTMHGALGQ